MLRPTELKAVVRVGTNSSAAARITQRLVARRVLHLEFKDLWIQEQVRSHEPKISRVKLEGNRADLSTKFVDPERHHKLIKVLPLSVPGRRRGLAKSAFGVVCSLLPVKATAGNQIETVEKTEAMSVVAGWPAKRIKKTCVDMTTWMLW